MYNKKHGLRRSHNIAKSRGRKIITNYMQGGGKKGRVWEVSRKQESKGCRRGVVKGSTDVNENELVQSSHPEVREDIYNHRLLLSETDSFSVKISKQLS